MRNEKSPTYILGFWTLISSNRWYFSIKKKNILSLWINFFLFLSTGWSGTNSGNGTARPGRHRWSLKHINITTPNPSSVSQWRWVEPFSISSNFTNQEGIKLKWKKYKARNVFANYTSNLSWWHIYFFGITYVPTFLRTLCRY